MPVVTLLSDLGTKDYYVAAVKGAILSECPTATLVDITHQVPAFDIAQAAFNIRNVYRDFPAGSIHLLGVDPADSNSHHLAVAYDGHIFLSADNGIFSLLCEREPESVTEIHLGEEDRYFPTRDKLAKAAGFLANGGQLEVLGPRVSGFMSRVTFQPVVTGNEIRGTVIYIDVFGNVFTNIDKTLFNNVAKNRPFSIFFAAANYPITKISQRYDDVPEGERLALFGSSGHLQIAINRGAQGAGGGASQLFGLKLNHSVRIDFEGN